MKIAIVTDSTAYLPKDVRERLGIRMIPLSVIFGDETYREEIDMTADEFFVKIKQNPKLPTTSQPSVGEFVDLFTAIREEGYEAVISIHLSSGISGTYQGAVTAGTMVDGLRVYAYDSEISCMAQGFYAIEAAEMAKAGKMPEEILARLDEMKRTLRAYFMVDDLSHLQRGGRLTGAQAFIGDLLQIKPLLHFENKVIVPFEKIRTRKKAIKRIEELFSEDAAKGVPLKAAIIHANQPDEAGRWRDELAARYPHVEFLISYFGPVIATHVGEGALGLTWYQP
ncbi:DegV family protein [Geobacillus stearothermophilus]|uniref:DegV family protein n=1 Tax=Geobacillus stearothermophilus TaxID=1422 RepID=UPI002402AEF1|nr:DegV family protein [Geobacillus stearothermophilus]MDF9297762.1 DegV family protein [Geobacillus stearothermophilus]